MNTKHLISRARAYATKAGLKESTVARKLLGSGKEFARIEAGGSLTVRSLERAYLRLAELEAEIDARAA